MNIDTLNSLGAGFCGHALAMLVQSGILVMALFLLDRLLRDRIRSSFRYAIWLLVLVKLVLPPQFASPTGVGYWLSRVAPSPASVTSSDNAHRKAMLSLYASHGSAADTAAAGFGHHISTELLAGSPAVAQPAAATLSLQAMLFCGWLAGLTGLLVAFGWRTVSMHRLILRTTPVGRAELDLLSECTDRAGYRGSVSMRLSGDIHSPAVCGFLWPVILIPESVISRLSREQLSTVLLHELSHIRRGDLWVHLAQVLLQLLYFYNPFVWLANSHIRRLRELANDEHVLVCMGGRRDSYTSALLEVAEVAFAGPKSALGFLGVVENPTRLKERIMCMMHNPIPLYSKLGLWGFAAIALLGSALLPMAAGPAALAAETKAAVPTLTQDQFLTQCRLAYDRCIQGYAKGNADDVVAYFADDVLGLCPHADLFPNKAQFVAAIGKSIANGNKYPGANTVYQDIYVSGKYVCAVDRTAAAVRVRSMPQVLVEYTKGLSISEIQPDGSLRTKVYAYTYDAVPDGLPAFSKEPVSALDGSFHAVPGNGQPASRETVEKVRQALKDLIAVYLKNDAQAAASFFTDNAILLPPYDSLLRGKDRIKADIADDLKKYEYLSWGEDVIAVEGTEQMVYMVGKCAMKMKDLTKDPSKGDNTITVPGKVAMVWQKQADGSWKILMCLVSVNG